MRRVTRMLPGVFLAGILVLGGCGKKEDQPTRFNQALGGTAVGVPTGAGPVDTAILKDQADYTPAPYEPLEGAAAAGGAATAGPDAEAIQTVLDNAIAAVFDLDLETLLDAFVPEQVAALRDDEVMSPYYETKDTLEAYWAVFQDKATGPEFESSTKLLELVPQLAEPITNAITVTVLDEENAVATFNLQAFELPEELLAAFAEAQAASAQAMAQMGALGMPGVPPGGTQLQEPAAAPGTPPAPGMPGMPPTFTPEMLQQMDVQIPLPLRKVDDEWKLVLPFSFQEEHAELIGEGLSLLKDIVAEMTAGIDQAETLDTQTYAQIAMQAQMSQMGAIMGYVARVQAMMASIMEAQPDDTGAAEAAEGEEEAAESSEPEGDPNADDRPEGRLRGP